MRTTSAVPTAADGIYGVVDKPTYALVIARDGDRFRLVEQFRYPLGLRRWEFPQGTAPGLAGEPEPAELAARELREETGLRAESMAVLGQLDVAPGMSSQRGWVFLATGITEGDHEREHEEQDMHSEWFTRDAARTDDPRRRDHRRPVDRGVDAVPAEGTPFAALMPVDQGITLDKPGFWGTIDSML